MTSDMDRISIGIDSYRNSTHNRIVRTNLTLFSIVYSVNNTELCNMCISDRPASSVLADNW